MDVEQYDIWKRMGILTGRVPLVEVNPYELKGVENVIIIANGIQIVDGEVTISEAAKCLADQAIGLLDKNVVRYILITGGNGPVDWKINEKIRRHRCEALTVQEYIHKLRPNAPIIMEARSKNTYENFSELIKVIDGMKNFRMVVRRKAIVLNHPDHIARTIVVGFAAGWHELYPVSIPIPWDGNAYPTYMRKQADFVKRNKIATIHHLVLGSKFNITGSGHPWF